MKAILALLVLTVAVASAHVLVPATGLTTVYPGVSYATASKPAVRPVSTVQYPVYKYHPQYQYVYQPVHQKLVYPGYSYGSVPLYGNTAYYYG